MHIISCKQESQNQNSLKNNTIMLQSGSRSHKKQEKSESNKKGNKKKNRRHENNPMMSVKTFQLFIDKLAFKIFIFVAQFFSRLNHKFRLRTNETDITKSAIIENTYKNVMWFRRMKPARSVYFDSGRGNLRTYLCKRTNTTVMKTSDPAPIKVVMRSNVTRTSYRFLGFARPLSPRRTGLSVLPTFQAGYVCNDCP